MKGKMGASCSKMIKNFEMVTAHHEVKQGLLSMGFSCMWPVPLKSCETPQVSVVFVFCLLRQDLFMQFRLALSLLSSPR